MADYRGDSGRSYPHHPNSTKRLKRERESSSVDHYEPRRTHQAPYPARDGQRPPAGHSADFVVVSRDGISISIKVYYLLAHSPYFRQLDANSVLISPHHMPLFHSETLDDLFCLMAQNPIDHWSFERSYIQRIKRLVDLCQHLQCESLLDRVTTRMKNLLSTHKSRAFDIFMVAAIAIDNPEICRRAIPAAARSLWQVLAVADDPYEHGVPHFSRLDITAMPRYLYDEIPTKYLFALGRAYRLRGVNARGSDGDWDQVAGEFYRLMTG